MRNRVDHLFFDKDFSDYRREQENRMVDEISSLSTGDLQHSNDTLALIFTSKYTPSRVHLYEHDLEQGDEVEKDVSHRNDLAIFDRSTPTYKTYQRLRLKLPFDGDKQLFLLKPSTFNFNPPIYNELHHNEVVYYVDYAVENKEPEEIQVEIESEVEKWLDDVDGWVDNLNQDIEQMEQQLHKKARSAIKRRRDAVDTNEQVMANLGVDSGETQESGYVIPEKKREIELPTPTEDSDDEEVLRDRTFIEILELVDDLGGDLERSGEQVRGLDEESLRDILLLGINSHYSGFATGETFNRGGKTDILLRYENVTLFVAECKFWDGQSLHQDAIDQLLDNLTVRDSHASLIVFSRRQNFTQVQERVRKTTKEHEQYITEDADFRDHEVYRLETERGSPMKMGVKVFDLG